MRRAPAQDRTAPRLPALLLARIYEVFPLLCPKCGGELRILAHLGEPTAPPGIAPARAPLPSVALR